MVLRASDSIMRTASEVAATTNRLEFSSLVFECGHQAYLNYFARV
jgi:hypothetical protein